MGRSPAARHVVLAMTGALVIYGSAYGLQYANDQDGRRIENPLPKLGGWETLIGWGFMFVFLIFLADLGAPGDLAVAFAYLFLVAILFTYGIEAFANLRELMGQSIGDDSTGNIEPPDKIIGPR